jgi:hypothetical protein
MSYKKLLPLIIVLIGTIIILAQIPNQMSYQGYLTDNNNQPVTGNKLLRFKIYDAPTGGNNLWTEEHTNVAILEGAFIVKLGSINSLNLSFDVPYWLGISVENEPELVPRTSLTSSAYSLNANAVRGPADSTNSNVFPALGNVTIGTVLPDTNKLHVEGDINLTGNLKINHAKPIWFKKYAFTSNVEGVDLPDADHRDYAAAIVGFNSGYYDVDENGSWHHMRVYLEKNPVTFKWTLWARDEGDSGSWPEFTVWIMYIDMNLVGDMVNY